MERPFVVAVSGLHRGDNPQPGPAVIRSIRRRYPSATVVGLSYDPLESGLFSSALDNVDAAFLMPFPAIGPNALLDRLDEIRRTYPIGIVIPCLDAEIPNYFALTDELRSREISVTLPTVQSFERRGKDKLAQLGQEAGVIVPRTIVAPDLSAAYWACGQIGYPLYLKGRLYEARYVTSPAEVAAAFHHLTAVWGAPVMAQEPVVGEEYDVAGLGDGEGELIGSCAIRKMMLTSHGKAFSGIVVDDPALQAQVERIIKALCWRGPFELEFVKGRFGHALIEMNPRFPAWIDFPSQIGCNLPAMLVENATSRATTPIVSCEAGRMFVRHCIDLVGDISQLAELSVTGTRIHDATLKRNRQMKLAG
jgi:carbamoyl-phosphate synthase large subunit